MRPVLPAPFPGRLFRPAVCLALAFVLAWEPCRPAMVLAASQWTEESRDPGLATSENGSEREPASGWEGFFAGSYLGGILFGYPVKGPALPDFLAACALGLMLMRALRSGRRNSGGGREKPRLTPRDLRGDYRTLQNSSRNSLPSDSPGSGRPGEDGRGDGEESAGSGLRPDDWMGGGDHKEMQKRARTVWDGLRSGRQDPGASSGEETAADLSGSGVPSGSVDPGVALPADFDAQDFLDGARLLYSRLQTSWAARNLEDLAPFTTPEMQNMLRRQAELEPAPGSVEVLLVTAVLTGFTRGQGEERVRVAFSALLQQGPEEEGKITVNEIWEFFRGPASGGGWRLSGIEQAPDSLAP